MSSGFIPDPFGSVGFRTMSMLIGALIALGMFGVSLRTRLNREKHGFRGGPLVFFIFEHALVSGLVLYLIAAVFIGGASASGGVGKVMGAVIGAFIMGVMNNGMSIMGVGIDRQQVVKGLVLLAAVIFDVYNRNKL
jgi:ABC-type xylose transport system permease subunit